MTSRFRYKNVEIVFLKHAGFQIKGSKIVYIDPYDIPKDSGLEKADYVLVTHDHFDHLDLKSIQRLSTPETTVIVPCGCLVEGFRTCELEPGQENKLDGIVVRCVPAYNIGKDFHPPGKGVGWVLELDGVKIYHAGDTDYIPEMKEVEADVALIPVGGTYTMDIEDAKKAIEELKAEVIIPMHYGTLPETKVDVSVLKSDKVVILEPMFK
ncbi:MAG: MBL fold metallo-hydrolase [Archaeoglobus sp.]|nr:MBL fold metallo-hydrolase [Archaeoglobus sp.]